MVQDAQNIQTLLDNMAKAWNLHDAAAFSTAFSEDADFTDAVGMNTYSRDSMRKFTGSHLPPWFKKSSLKITGRKSGI